MNIDAMMDALARGERVSRHSYDVDRATIDSLLKSDILKRDNEGYLVAGPLFRLHTDMGDSL